jgi:transposase
MNKRQRIRDDEWERIKEMLPGKPSDPGRTARDNRGFIDEVMWIGRTGSPWRDLPPERGKWRQFINDL